MELKRHAGGMLAQARRRANDKGHPFDLSPDYVMALLSSGRCAVTGIEWDLSTNGNRIRPWAPSIDRINSDNGYVRGNVQVVCTAVNLAKSDLTPKQFAKLCSGLARHALRLAVIGV